jgi:peptidoglycan/xylan/chitin deacetylase (PgdA/CDA1 family)
MTILLLTAAAIAVLLYARWRSRYRHPPDDVPRVLCYHKFSDRFCFEGTWIPRRRFVDQVDHLMRRGYRFIDETEYFESLLHRTKENARKILLTFDDGYAELRDVFVEELVPRGVPALVFLVAGFAGRENTWDLSVGRRPFSHLSWDQVCEMASLGARFGSHGLTHADLTRLDPEAVRREVAESRESIGEQTGVEVRSFSYPFGRYDGVSKAAVEAAGYTGGFSLYPHHPNEYVDWFCIRRNAVYIIDTSISLEWKLERSPFAWFEEMKCRTINALAALTPILKKFSPDR